MNAEEFHDYDDDYYNYHIDYYSNNNATFAGNRSGVNGTGQHSDESTQVDAMSDVIFYVILTLGIPGNVLSAIVWLRRHVSRRNSSAIYLVSLSVERLFAIVRPLKVCCVHFKYLL